MLRGVPFPSCWAMRISYSPDSSVNQAIDLPSGDQAGLRSFAATDCVRLRSSPFSIGTVMISPRNSNAARAPLGERLAPRMYFAPLTNRGRVSLRSAATPTFDRLLDDLRSVSRVRRLGRIGNRKLCRHSASHRHREELREAPGVDLARR